MTLEECVVGRRVRSTSDGFTRGIVGIVTELGQGGDPVEPAAFLKVLDPSGNPTGLILAVAVRLLEPAPTAGELS